DLVHVPYRGSGPATADTISGQVAMVTPAVTGALLEFNRTGKLRILAVTSPTRLIAAPAIPTAVEAGLPGMVSQQSIGLFAPAGTPKAIIEQISQATRAALADATYRQMLIESGFEPDIDSTPDKFRRLIGEDIARWSPLVKAIGLKLEPRRTARSRVRVCRYAGRSVTAPLQVRQSRVPDRQSGRRRPRGRCAGARSGRPASISSLCGFWCSRMEWPSSRSRPTTAQCRKG